MSINLNVSIGEAIDKLTILHIKKDKIKDKRLNDVVVEFDYLNKELEFFINQYKYYYNILKKVNLEIWELQDIIRDNKNNENYTQLTDEILNLNDSRYIVKKKINEISNSKFKEQKGYNLRICYLLTEFTKKNYYILNGAIRYLSFIYDEIKIIVNQELHNYVKDMFEDDPFISIILDNEKIEEKYDLLLTGVDKNIFKEKITHSYMIPKINNIKNEKNIINKLYSDIYLNENICKDYFKYKDNIVFDLENI